MTAAPSMTGLLRFTVSVTQGVNAGQIYSFEKSLVTIGRGPENDLVFPDDSKMSRTHVEVHAQSTALKVKNISQKNFILIDDDQHEEKVLSKPFVLQVGETVLQFDFEVEPEPVILKVVAHASPPAVKAPPKPRAQSPAMAQPFGNRPLTPFNPSMNPPPHGAAPSAAKKRPAFRSVSSQSGSRTTFYVILAVVAVLGWWLLGDSDQKKKTEVYVRTEGDVARAIEDSANAVREIKKKQEASGQDSIQYRSAQEHYIKGFRDYRSGQYARAMQSFQASLSFYPNHELSRKYLIQSQRKFDALVDHSMSLGRKYYQKQNYKMCQASFANVMVMLKDNSKPKYREARQLFEECNLRLEGRF